MAHDNRLKVKKKAAVNDNLEFVVAGYTFKSKKAAEDAKDELNAIKYMSSKTNQKDPAQVYVLYNKILDKELFRTAVGIDYLKSLQQYLYISKSIPNDRIRPIPINQDIQEVIDGRRETAKHRDELRDMTRQSNHYKDMFIKTLIINIILVIGIVIILMITMNSSNANVLNYENNIQDKYASWQEELQSREAVIKQQERELGIVN